MTSSLIEKALCSVIQTLPMATAVVCTVLTLHVHDPSQAKCSRRLLAVDDAGPTRDWIQLRIDGPESTESGTFALDPRSNKIYEKLPSGERIWSDFVKPLKTVDGRSSEDEETPLTRPRRRCYHRDNRRHDIVSLVVTDYENQEFTLTFNVVQEDSGVGTPAFQTWKSWFDHQVIWYDWLYEGEASKITVSLETALDRMSFMGAFQCMYRNFRGDGNGRGLKNIGKKGNEKCKDQFSRVIYNLMDLINTQQDAQAMRWLITEAAKIGTEVFKNEHELYQHKMWKNKDLWKKLCQKTLKHSVDTYYENNIKPGQDKTEALSPKQYLEAITRQDFAAAKDHVYNALRGNNTFAKSQRAKVRNAKRYLDLCKWMERFYVQEYVVTNMEPMRDFISRTFELREQHGNTTDPQMKSNLGREINRMENSFKLDEKNVERPTFIALRKQVKSKGSIVEIMENHARQVLKQWTDKKYPPCPCDPKKWCEKCEGFREISLTHLFGTKSEEAVPNSRRLSSVLDLNILNTLAVTLASLLVWYLFLRGQSNPEKPRRRTTIMKKRPTFVKGKRRASHMPTLSTLRSEGNLMVSK